MNMDFAPGPEPATPRRNAALQLASRWCQATLAVALFLGFSASAEATIHVYLNSNTGNIPDAASEAACDSSGLFISFVVPATDNFVIDSVALGVNITHLDRNEVYARLYHPNGTTFDTVIPFGGTGGSSNYDIYLSSDPDAEGALNDGDLDPQGEPFYFRQVHRADLAGDFDGLAANGTWTLRVCDLTPDGNDGTKTVNGAMLVLSSATTTATRRCAPSALTTLNWGSFADRTNFSTTTVPAGGVTVTETATDDFGGDGNNGAGGPGNFVTRTDQLGAEFGYYSLYMDAVGTADSETVGERVSFAFSYPAANLSFTINDIDWFNPPGNPDFEDQVRVYGTGPGGARVPYVYSGIGDRIDANGDMLEGNDGDSDVDEARGSATITFDGPVSSVSLEYTQGDEPVSSAQDQRIGIGDFNFCAFDYGDAPTSYGTVARHPLGPDSLYLGTIPGDGESAHSGNNAASADDGNNPFPGVDDEDRAAAIPAMTAGPGGTYTVPSIVVRNTTGNAATLCGWIDFDINGQSGQDGSFQANEGSCTTVPASGSGGGCTESPTGTFTCSLSWIVPADFVRVGSAILYHRYRVTPADAGMTTAHFNSNPTIGGVEQPGEIEDYGIAAGTLPVTIARVETSQSGRSVVVRFTTATESGNAGFRIWGVNAASQQVLLATLKSKGSDSFSPQSYVAAVHSSGVGQITIEDVSLFGANRVHGPFAVGASYGEEPESAAIDWVAIRDETGVSSALDRLLMAESSAGSSSPVAQSLARVSNTPAGGLLFVNQEGLHRVSFEELLAAGINLAGVSPSRIAIVDNGVGVARFVSTVGATFGPGGVIEFVARPQLTLASPVDVYVLTVDSSKAVNVASMSTGKGGLGVTRAVDLHRPDNVYSYSSPNGDPWFDAQMLAWGAPTTASRSFDLPNLTSGQVNLKLRVWGWADFDGAAPDHHLIVKVNGTEVAQNTFDGGAIWEPVLNVTDLVNESGNTLELVLPGDTGYAFDNIAFEGFETSYSRATVALGERFKGSVAGGFAIDGFAPGQFVSVWHVDGSSVARSLQRPLSGRVSAAGGAGVTYAASQGSFIRPGISAEVPSSKLASAAQYLIVTHPAFAGSIDDLVALEESRGFTTEVVTVDRIFAAYSDHASSAEALKSFLSASLATGDLRYVLLVGADTTDPYNHLGLGSVSYVPTDYRDFVPYVTFSPTDESLVDRAGDGLGDVPIGRLPVRTPSELNEVVAKLVAWEQSIAGSPTSALLVAGASDSSSRMLASINETYAASLQGWNTVLAQVDDSNSATVRQQVIDGINSGIEVVSYVGHSSMGQWDFTPIVRWQDVGSLTNAGLPNFFTAWGCWNSYYVEPTIESLSARLLREPNVGAAGAIGATTLTSESSHRELGNLFFARVNAGATTIGEAFHGAKADLMQQGGAADAIYGMTLLGDPAMSLPANPAQH
jgi:hypothetical protein